MSLSAVIKEFEQLPTDKLDYDFDYAFPKTDSVQSAVVSFEPAGPECTLVEMSGRTVKAWITGGESRTTYTVSCRAVSVDGRRKTLKMKLNIL